MQEWYGWHFPELDRIVNDNLAYARIILAMGTRENAATADLSEILPDDIEARLKAGAEVSISAARFRPSVIPLRLEVCCSTINRSRLRCRRFLSLSFAALCSASIESRVWYALHLI